MRTDWTNTKVYTTNGGLIEFYVDLVGGVWRGTTPDTVGVFNTHGDQISYFEEGSSVDLGEGYDCEDVTQEVTALYKEYLDQVDSAIKEGLASGVSDRLVEDIIQDITPPNLESAIETVQSYLRGSGVELQIFEDRLDIMCLADGYDGDSLRVESVVEVVEFVESVKTLRKLGYK